MSNPEDFNPSFKPNTAISQSTVAGRVNIEQKNFESFLLEINTWKIRKQKKLGDLKEELEKQHKEICTHKPHIDEKSANLFKMHHQESESVFKRLS